MMTSYTRSMAAALAATMLAGAAQAAPDPIAASRAAILAGDTASAEHMLSAERRVYPQRQDVLLNLAAVYAGTGRAGEAAALYKAVLDRRDIVMDVDGSRTASAHAIAQRGLSRIAVVQTASR